MIHDKNFPFHEPEDETEIIHVGHGHRGGAIGKTIIVVLIIIAIFFGARALFNLGKGDAMDNGMAVIEPNPEPYKVAPENPGGMNIPHIDKEIYGRLKMPIEEPIDIYDQHNHADPISRAAEEESKYTKEVMKLESYSEKKVMAASEPTTSRSEPKAMRIGVDGREIKYDNSKVLTVGTQAHKAKRIDVEKVLSKKNASEIWLQLGSFKVEEEATKAWQDNREKNSDVLKDLTIKVTKSDMKDQGVLYRLQAGPVEDERAAKTFCVKLNERKQSCFFTSLKGTN